MTIEEIQDMWNKDSVIDPDNLHLESIRIPQLHSKYFQIYNNFKLLQKKLNYEYCVLKKERYDFYKGKASPEIYAQEPFPQKLIDKDTIVRYIDADKKLNELKMKNEYYLIVLNFIEEILKVILNRTYQIKNSIEFQKFIAGYS
jgi:hypothetical protein